MNGPLNSLKVIEFSGLGPGPLAGQLLADLGADVITIDRKSADIDPTEINRRNKRSPPIASDNSLPPSITSMRLKPR